jgi:lysophospholipase
MDTTLPVPRQAEPRMTPPGPREPTELLHFSASDGAALYGELHMASGPASALVVHGYAEHCGRYREVCNVLQGLGLTTLAFDLRGHGRSAGQRGHVRRFDDYLLDIEAALAELQRRAGAAAGGRVLLVAHSNGALASLRLLGDPWRRPAAIRAAVLSSPFLELRAKVPRAKVLAARALGGILPSLSLPLDLDINILTRDEAKLGERRLDTLCHDVASARWFTGSRQTQRWVAEFARRIEVPTLWLIGGGDQLCNPDTAERVASSVKGAEIHVLAGMAHEVFNEVDRGDAFALAANFARRTVLG